MLPGYCTALSGTSFTKPSGTCGTVTSRSSPSTRGAVLWVHSHPAIVALGAYCLIPKVCYFEVSSSQKNVPFKLKAPKGTMSLCYQCQCLSHTPVARMPTSEVAFRHDYNSLMEAVEANCYMCKRVWDSLSQRQQDVVRSPGFTGIECRISFETKGHIDDEKKHITLGFWFDAGAELDIDCNEIGGWHNPYTTMGHFVVLDPTRTSQMARVLGPCAPES